MSFNLTRTPPLGRQSPAAQAEEQLQEHYRQWRRGLHKARDYRVKVLRTLAQEGDGEAAAILGVPPWAYGAVRCKECAGCLLMAGERACASCTGCLQGRGCEEHHRCRNWPRNFATYHDGSEITAISSQFDLMMEDLSKYEAVIAVLRKLDVEMEEDLDQLAEDSRSCTNPRFSAEARHQEIDDERDHHVRLVTLLHRHSEVLHRMRRLDLEQMEIRRQKRSQS